MDTHDELAKISLEYNETSLSYKEFLEHIELGLGKPLIAGERLRAGAKIKLSPDGKIYNAIANPTDEERALEELHSLRARHLL